MDTDFGEAEEHTAEGVEKEDTRLFDVKHVAVQHGAVGELTSVDGEQRLITPEWQGETERSRQCHEPQREGTPPEGLGRLMGADRCDCVGGHGAAWKCSPIHRATVAAASGC